MPTDRQDDRNTLQLVIILETIQEEIDRDGKSKTLDKYISQLKASLERP